MKPSLKSVPTIDFNKNSSLHPDDDLLSVGNCSFQSVYQGFVDCITRSRHSKVLKPLVKPASEAVQLSARKKSICMDEPIMLPQPTAAKGTILDEARKNFEQLKEIQAELEKMPLPSLKFNLNHALTQSKPLPTARQEIVHARKKSCWDYMLTKNTMLNMLKTMNPIPSLPDIKRRSVQGFYSQTNLVKSPITKSGTIHIIATSPSNNNLHNPSQNRFLSHLRQGKSSIDRPLKNLEMLPRRGRTLPPPSDKGMSEIPVTQSSKERNCLSSDEVAVNSPFKERPRTGKSQNNFYATFDAYSTKSTIDKGNLIGDFKCYTIKTTKDIVAKRKSGMLRAMANPRAMTDAPAIYSNGMKFV